MRQVIENSRNGAITIPEVAAPSCRAGTMIVENRASLINPGTEAAMIRFGQKGLLQKAQSRPDLVKQVIRKMQADGLIATYKAVQDRLDVPTPLGYSSAGQILEVGASVEGLKPGDRVACAGAGYASHAELVAVPKNLVVRIPEAVPFEAAAFATTGAIALQGLRVGDVRVGERVVVVGLGLIGLLTVQLLKAAGCLVLGTDPNPARVDLARQLGANEACPLDPDRIVEAVDGFTCGRGADTVIITAATDSSQPVEVAGEISRLKGRVVVVGQVGMDVPRRTFYHKELELRFSMSYGPGRYDPNYEEKGIDYPYAYVPFTEQRNMETFLQLVAEGRVTPERLITHRFPVAEAQRAYALIKGEVKEIYLGVLLTYPEQADRRRTIPMAPAVPAAGPEPAIRLAMIGAGLYARSMLLPKIKALKDVQLVGVSTTRGPSADASARKFGFEFASTDVREILDDPRINLVAITTRHDSHARLAQAALEAGKHVLVEKPMATNEADLLALVRAAGRSGRHLQVGFNRRFAPLVQRAKEEFRDRAQPLAMSYRVNAGALPSGHWHQDTDEGGGRIIGEGCHFIDLMQYLCGADPVSVFATSISGNVGAIPAHDVVTVTIRFADGSIGTLHYFANGDKSVPKEYLEVYGGGRTFILDDFRRARFAEGGRVARWKRSAQDKGQAGEVRELVEAIRANGPTPVPLREAVLTTLTTFRTLDSLRSGAEVPVGWAIKPGDEGDGASGAEDAGA
jgi:predicted dehydrogenase/threonine dehydrogenase-like Zn-dependent dehydrogenase